MANSIQNAYAHVIFRSSHVIVTAAGGAATLPLPLPLPTTTTSMA